MIAPLHNLEAEQALLGALLFNNRLLERLPLRFGPGDFYDPVHGLIFRAAAARIGAGQVADGVTLRAHFLESGALTEIGGAAYLLTLMENAARISAEALEYAAIIQDLARRRALEEAGLAIMQEARMDQARPLNDLLAAAERRLRAVDTGGGAYIDLQSAGEAVAAGLRLPEGAGIRTGLAKLDALLGGGFHAPDFVIIAGRPAMGKTALADNIAVNIAASGRVVASFSMEMSAEQIAARALSRRSSAFGPSFAYADLRAQGAVRPQADRVAQLVPHLPASLFIDPTGAQTAADIEATARDMRRDAGRLDLILVDYLQLMRDPQARRDGRTQELSQITADLKAMAKRLACPVVALSQLSRAVEGRADKRPQLSDLRESGTIEQDADIVLFCYREFYYLERNKPKPEPGEDDRAFTGRKLEHARRMSQTARQFELYTGKNRHAAGGQEELYCDLAMDIIADEDPAATPHPSNRGYD